MDFRKRFSALLKRFRRIVIWITLRVHIKSRWTVRTGKRSILKILKRQGDCEESIVEVKNARVSGQTKSLDREGENEG